MAAQIITISRQYGSGGREVGEKLASRLGYTYYDKEIIKLAVEESNISEEFFEKDGESSENMLSYFLSFANGAASADQDTLPLPDRIFLIQSRVIKELAAKGPCVIIGRSADFVLRDEPDILKVLIYADKMSRVQRVMRRNSLTEKGAAARIKKIDKGRALYYEQFTGNKWCDPFVHDVCISTSRFSIDAVVDIIADMAVNHA